jgi:hypothetical protein
VWGTPRLSGTIDSPISRHPNERVKMAVSNAPMAKPAITHYELLAKGELDRRPVSLVQCRLETGRTHQIRVHMQSLGYSLVGDTVYGKPHLLSFFHRQALQARRLGLSHPATGEHMEWVVPLAERLRRAARAFRHRRAGSGLMAELGPVSCLAGLARPAGQRRRAGDHPPGGVSAAPFDDGKGGGGLNLGLHVKDDPEAVRENRARLQPCCRAVRPGSRRCTAPTWSMRQLVQPGAPVQTGDASTAVDARRGVRDPDRRLPAGAVCRPGWQGGGRRPCRLARPGRRRAGGDRGAHARPGRRRDHRLARPGDRPASLRGRRGRAGGLPRGAAGWRRRGGLPAYPGREGKYLADMPLLARRMLARDGVTRVHGGDRCTFSERDRFYSYRRDGAGSGRQASLIWH